jgi:molybdate transport system substrate-binding protein
VGFNALHVRAFRGPLTMSQENAMKIRVLVPAANLALMFLFTLSTEAGAAELKVLSTIGMQSVMQDLGPKFEHASGYKLAISFATAGATVKRVQAGETTDVVLNTQPGIDSLVKDGKAAAGNVTVIARSGIGVAVRKGATRPDISSPEALKRTLLGATSITYVDPGSGGASGIHFASVLARLGIAADMKSKTVFPDPNDPIGVGVLVANREAEIGVHVIPQLISLAGIDLVGPLPGDLQDTIVFSAAIMTGTKDERAAKALIDFLRTAEAAAVIAAKGMKPAR